MSLRQLINPIYALGFTDIRLPLENTLVTLQRLHSLAFGFETFAVRQKTKLSCLSTVFQGQPDIGSNEISEIKISLRMLVVSGYKRPEIIHDTALFALSLFLE
jgi:hypothetical protein